MSIIFMSFTENYFNRNFNFTKNQKNSVVIKTIIIFTVL